MSYRFSANRPVEAEVRRIARRQLTRAESELSAGSPKFRQKRIRTARKRLKKVRALLRLVRPSLGKAYRQENRVLRDVSHRLGVVSDSAAVIEAVERLGARYRDVIPSSLVDAFRRSVVRCTAAAPSMTSRPRALAPSAVRLHAERQHAARWVLHDRGFAAVAGGLERSYRDGRQAMREACARPTVHRLHTWRRRAKDEWLQMRLLDTRCRGQLRADARVLEALDGVLGEYHDVALLKGAVERESSLTRDQKAAILRAIARERRRLRRRAGVLAARIYDEKPKAFVQRVERLWSAADRTR